MILKEERSRNYITFQLKDWQKIPNGKRTDNVMVKIKNNKKTIKSTKHNIQITKPDKTNPNIKTGISQIFPDEYADPSPHVESVVLHMLFQWVQSFIQ